ncbi:hypothetical protein BgiBS90_019079 [Biomphalaria glabrata]|nr:hypothetical protein BgiBS90_019079 [Biomphalaria glabrata]
MLSLFNVSLINLQGGVIYKSRGIYVDCTFNRCTYNSKTVSAWQDTARFLFYVMWTIILVTVIINGLSLWILAARLPRIFALLYFSAAVIGILITIIFPITVSPIGKDGLSETWFSSANSRILPWSLKGLKVNLSFLYANSSLKLKPTVHRK